MESIFSRTYKYKQTEKKNNLENFLIEIFCYCLQTDTIFRKKFLSLIKLDDIEDSYKITSQKIISNNKRPDIYIEKNNSVCLIECKVDSNEGDGQLDNYLQYLTRLSSVKHKKLVYLTKYQPGILNNDLVLITWEDIYKCIDNTNKDITQQLKMFLIEKRIILMKDFNTEDKLALTTITDSIHKLNFVLDGVKSICEKQHSIKFKQNTRATRLIKGGYYDILDLNCDWILDVGFFGLNTDDMTIGIRIFEHKASVNKEVNLNNFKSRFNDWIYQDNEYGYWYGTYRSFLSGEDLLTSQEAVDFIVTKINDYITKKPECNTLKNCGISK